MNPRHYAMDSQNRADDLAAAILSASAPPQIASVCRAVASFLRRHAVDQSRAFFSSAFPALICRFFGFDDSSSTGSRSGWIDRAVLDAELSGDIFDLLSPDGILFASIEAADRHSLVKYVFPIERLPEWMRFALQSDRHAAVLPELCPLFKSGVKEDKVQRCFHPQLNVFEYFVFWFAYFPVCRGSRVNVDAAGAGKSKLSRLENWTSSLHGLASAGRRSGQKTECNLYLHLLFAYLRAFVNKSGWESHQPYRSSLLHYSSTYNGTGTSIFMQAEFFVNTLVHFWMVDNDFSPFSASIYRPFGVSFPLRMVLVDIPPTPGLGEVLKLVVKYLNRSFSSLAEGHRTPVLKVSGSSDIGISTGYWNSVMRRPLYRFILRTFLYCPIDSSLKNVTEVVELWMTYLTPWAMKSYEDCTDFRSFLSSSDGLKSRSIPSHEKDDKIVGYNSNWQGYVLSSYLFYSSMFVHFLEFVHKFIHANVDAVIPLVLKVLSVMTSSHELLELLKKVDTAYHSKPAVLSSLSDNLHKYVPSIREQLLDWEDGLFEGSNGMVFSHDNQNANLRFFGDGEDGAYHLLQLLILRTEHEFGGALGEAPRRLQALDSIKTHMNLLFAGHITKPSAPILSEDPTCSRRGGEAFTPKKHRKVVQHPVGSGREHTGDWLRRPVSDNEVKWMARWLIWLSNRINQALGFNEVEVPNRDRQLTLVSGLSDNIWVGGPWDAIRKLASFLGSCFEMLAGATAGLLRSYGVRVNLRVLASKKLVMFLLFCVLLAGLKRAVFAPSDGVRARTEVREEAAFFSCA